MTAPCFGQHKLFDSTDICDHIEAARICATCPLIDACRGRLAEALTHMHATYGPEGTWAGELYSAGRARAHAKEAQRRAREDAAYTEDEARECVNRWAAGERSDYLLTGRRVYERRRRAHRRTLPGAAA